MTSACRATNHAKHAGVEAVKTAKHVEPNIFQNKFQKMILNVEE